MHARAFAAHRVVKGVGMVLVGALTFGIVGATTAAVRITGNITSVDADRVFAEHGIVRPEMPPPEDLYAGQTLNILIMGTDSREGENAELGGENEGARSNTTMIMQLSADRRNVWVVSIPRDTIVDVPQCPTTDGSLTTARSGIRFGHAFAIGKARGGNMESGALCQLATVEAITNVRMDGFVVMDFISFRDMVDALGGVDMYLPGAIFSPRTNYLTLAAGWHRFDGTTALQYARARTGQGLGDGSDLRRIERQQDLMMAIAGEALDSNLLTDAPQLIRFLNAVTDSMLMSSNFASVTGLVGLGHSLRHVRPDNINFLMTPITANPADRNTVLFTEDIERVWDNLRHGRPLDTPAGDNVTDDNTEIEVAQ